MVRRCTPQHIAPPLVQPPGGHGDVLWEREAASMRAKANEARGLHDEGIVSRMGPNTMVQLLWWCFLWGSGLLERIGCPRALASPGARVGLAPLPDAVDLGRAAEGSTVVGGGRQRRWLAVLLAWRHADVEPERGRLALRGSGAKQV